MHILRSLVLSILVITNLSFANNLNNKQTTKDTNNPTGSTHSEQYNQDYAALKNRNINYTVFGTICEQVAKLRMEKKYPLPEYKVVSGIIYRSGNRTLGELDVVVIRTNDKKAIIITEVKCWNKLTRALKKAKKQLARFRDTISSGRKISLSSSTKPRKKYQRAQFDDNIEYLTMSQNGGLEAGFDNVLNLSMDEVKELRSSLMAVSGQTDSKQGSSSKQLEADFQKLKTRKVNYKVFGTICEQVAKLRLEKEYPQPEYKVVSGIAYSNSKRTIGELDVIVFRQSDQEAILISEVKCWRKLGPALRKARGQLNRFKNYIKSGKKVIFTGTNSKHKKYQVTQFDEKLKYITFSQNGGIEKGFTKVLGLTMREVKKLRKRLMKCQRKRRCAR